LLQVNAQVLSLAQRALDCETKPDDPRFRIGQPLSAGRVAQTETNSAAPRRVISIFDGGARNATTTTFTGNRRVFVGGDRARRREPRRRGRLRIAVRVDGPLD